MNIIKDAIAILNEMSQNKPPPVCANRRLEVLGKEELPVKRIDVLLKSK